ncbi:MAG: metal-dependent transcriptional regulator, partial [Spirochaetia bacterium]|nr:metal-dependent transcriptional regulator [Spirochaetia bacterium]
LKDLGYISHNPYGAISLTPEGKKRGEEILYRHTFLTKFLIEIIEVDKETAEVDACRIEHVLSKQTMENLMRFYSTYKGLKNKK